jgi:hypothetical protein
MIKHRETGNFNSKVESEIEEHNALIEFNENNKDSGLKLTDITIEVAEQLKNKNVFNNSTLNISSSEAESSDSEKDDANDFFY